MAESDEWQIRSGSAVNAESKDEPWDHHNLYIDSACRLSSSRFGTQASHT